ncbi:MAG: hypothetical protein IT236_03610 [Bacteroidia bacterium]|nr:hypothetical protein [Bacteroidia bacterium]
MQFLIKVEVRPYRHAELIKLFNSSKTRFNNDIRPFRKKLGPRHGHSWSIRQVEMIFEILDHPYIIIGE